MVHNVISSVFDLVRLSNSVETNPWIEFDSVRFLNVRFTMPGLKAEIYLAQVLLRIKGPKSNYFMNHTFSFVIQHPLFNLHTS